MLAGREELNCHGLVGVWQGAGGSVVKNVSAFANRVGPNGRIPDYLLIHSAFPPNVAPQVSFRVVVANTSNQLRQVDHWITNKGVELGRTFSCMGWSFVRHGQ